MQNVIEIVRIIYSDKKEDYFLDLVTVKGRAYVKISKKMSRDIISALELIADKETGELPMTIKYMLP